jgi:hypothetical protein
MDVGILQHVRCHRIDILRRLPIPGDCRGSAQAHADDEIERNYTGSSQFIRRSQLFDYACDPIGTWRFCREQRRQAV